MIAHFSLRLICGMSLMWCLMPRREVTTGFFRIQMLVVLGLSVLAALTLERVTDDVLHRAPLLSPEANIGLCVLLAIVAFVGSVLWTLGRRRAGDWFVWLVAGVALVLLVCSSPRLRAGGAAGDSLRLISDLSSAALLGGAMTTMLLGHWYLTAPTMSIEPLRRLTWYFGGSGLLRLLVSAAALAMAWSAISDPAHWLWLCLRWTAGVIGPLAVFIMVWRILKYRNTQSATGVLFVGVILTFIGEMTSSLLYRELSRPF